MRTPIETLEGMSREELLAHVARVELQRDNAEYVARRWMKHEDERHELHELTRMKKGNL